MSEKKEIPVRYNVPTIYSKANFKDICRVILNYNSDNQEEYRYFIQTSLDDNHPYWEEMGDFLTKVFEPKFTTEKFIDECFKTLDKTENVDVLK
jgi:hypothetical protein